MKDKPKEYRKFGKLVWEWLTKQYGEPSEDMEDLLAFAGKCGLARQVEYDPVMHGEISSELVEPGDMIWFWGEEKPSLKDIEIQPKTPWPRK